MSSDATPSSPPPARPADGRGVSDTNPLEVIVELGDHMAVTSAKVELMEAILGGRWQELWR